MKKIFSIIAALSMVLPYFGNSPILVHASAGIFSDGFESDFSNWTSVDQSSGENKGWKIIGSGYEGLKRAQAEGNGSNKILLKEISTAGLENIVISFYHKDAGLETADSVNVEYFNGTNWINIVTFTDGNEVNNSSSNAWVNFSQSLGNDAENLSVFAVRFVSTLDAASDKFDLDGFSITGDEIEEVEPEEPPVLVCNPEVNLIQNGSFEEPTITNPDLWDIFTNVPGWQIDWVNNYESTPSLELQGGWLPALGAQYAELDGDLFGPENPTPGGSSKISQTINTIPGKNYKLKFSFSGRPNTDESQNILGVTWGGENVVGTPLILSNLVNLTNWNEYTFDLVATSSQTQVSFMDQGTENALGTFIDNVSLHCQNQPTDPCTYGSQVFYSDTSHTVGDGLSKATWAHPYWIATTSPAVWMWSDTEVQNPTEDEVKVFTKTISLSGSPTSGILSVAADNSYQIKINGSIVASTTSENNYALFTDYDVTSELNYGDNLVEIIVHNFKPVGFEGTAQTNPAGIIYALYVDTKLCPGDTPNNPGKSKIHFAKYIVGSGAANYEGEGAPIFNLEIAGGPHGDLLLSSPSYTNTSSELTNGNNSVTVYEEVSEEGNVLPYGASCVPGKYRFAGYGVGSSFGSAAEAATTTDHLVFTNIDSDKYVVVWNELCPEPPVVEDECESGFVLEGESCVPEEDNEGDDEDDSTPPAAQSTQTPGGRRRDVSGLFSSGGGEVLGASTDESLTCEPYLKEYIKFGANNNPEEVKKLQIFLNQFFELDNPVTGFYGQLTFDMVKKFQAHQEAGTLTPWMVAGLPTDGPTGYVYKTTKRWINILKCPEMIQNTPIPNLP
jgi:hypothetical protein